MTTENFEKAKKIVLAITEIEKTIEDIDRLIQRAEEISPPTHKTIPIQLGEQYIHTPIASVDRYVFLNMLTLEKDRLEHQTNVLKTEFEEL